MDLTDAVGHFSDLFDPDALALVTVCSTQTTEQRALYALPMGRTTNHVHVWKSLLEQAGFTLEDIPREWEAFWSFWCDEVQPAVREATGRDDVWGVGPPHVGRSRSTPQYSFMQFIHAYEADYVTRDGRLVIDDPEVRRRLIEAIDSYTAVYRKGCTPPDSVDWDGYGNNEAVPGADRRDDAEQDALDPQRAQARAARGLLREHRDDRMAAWPDGEAFPIIEALRNRAVVFKDGDHVATAKEFVRFLVGEGWLAHYLNFSGERMLPPMPKLLDAPFWLDPSDPHRMASVMQIASKPLHLRLRGGLGRLAARPGLAGAMSGRKAIHRVAADGISPEQAVDEAIARIKQILAE